MADDTDTDLTDAIAENAKGPASASGDSGSMSQHSIQDQIAADRYLASKRAARTGFGGLRFVKFVPPGTAD
jgi:hypothetical protein